MKGLSVVFTILLLLLAHRLAIRLSKAGTLPADTTVKPGLVAENPLALRGHAALRAGYTL